jgi:hypothetical protein
MSSLILLDLGVILNWLIQDNQEINLVFMAILQVSLAPKWGFFFGSSYCMFG